MENTNSKTSYQRKSYKIANKNIGEFTKNNPETFLLPIKPQFVRYYIIVLLIALIICIFSFIKLGITG